MSRDNDAIINEAPWILDDAAQSRPVSFGTGRVISRHKVNTDRDNDACWHDYGGVKLMPMHFAGHALYVRKCQSSEAFQGDESIRSYDGIVVRDHIGDMSQWVEVLAVGPNVGKRCTKQHASRLRPKWVEAHGLSEARRSNVPQGIVGHLAYIAVNDDPRIKQSPMSPDEFFIEESLPLAILPSAA